MSTQLRSHGLNVNLSKAGYAFVLVLIAGFFNSAMAQGNSNGLTPNVFSLSASSTGEAVNDLMRVTVSVQAEGEDPSELQSKINATTQWALARLKPFITIKVKLETDDVTAAGEAIRKLQERLAVTSIHFEPKPQTRRVVEDQLINEALNAFKQRAQLIRTNIGSNGYTLLDVNVQTGFQGGQRFRRNQEYDVSQSSSVEAPGLAGGSSQITVQVQGRIQLGTPLWPVKREGLPASNHLLNLISVRYVQRCHIALRHSACCGWGK